MTSEAGPRLSSFFFSEQVKREVVSERKKKKSRRQFSTVFVFVFRFETRTTTTKRTLSREEHAQSFHREGPGWAGDGKRRKK